MGAERDQSGDDIDSAGVYFLDVSEFEWRPGRSEPASETNGSREGSQNRDAPAGAAPRSASR